MIYSRRYLLLTFSAIVALVLLVTLRTSASEKLDPKTRVRYGITRNTAGYGATVLYHFYFADPVILNDKSTTEIEAIRETAKDASIEKILGLTVGDFRQDCTYQFRTRRKFFSKGYLLWVEDLKVDLSCNDLKIYIANQYQPGSCEYEETMKHEMEHVAIHKEVYEKYSKVLEDAFSNATGIPSKRKPLLVGDAEEGQTRLGDLISSIANPVFNQYQTELGEKEASIDTPANYRGINSRCSNW